MASPAARGNYIICSSAIHSSWSCIDAADDSHVYCSVPQNFELCQIMISAGVFTTPLVIGLAQLGKPLEYSIMICQVGYPYPIYQVVTHGGRDFSILFN